MGYFRGTSTRDAEQLTNNVRKFERADFDYAGFVDWSTHATQYENLGIFDGLILVAVCLRMVTYFRLSRRIFLLWRTRHGPAAVHLRVPALHPDHHRVFVHGAQVVGQGAVQLQLHAPDDALGAAVREWPHRLQRHVRSAEGLDRHLHGGLLLHRDPVAPELLRGDHRQCLLHVLDHG